MTIFFQPDIVAFGDHIGWGWWLDSHNQEHQQFATMGLTRTVPFHVPAYDLTAFAWEDPQVMTDWLNVHDTIHDVLRDALNIEGFDLSAVDLNNQADFQIWVDAHADEHGAIRAALGIFV